MTEARFRRTSEWLVDAPRRAVYETLLDLASVGEWWPDFDRIRRLADGSVRARVRGPLRSHFDLRFRVVDARPHDRIVIEADGDLRGRGVFSLTEGPGRTRVSYDWDVRIDAPWLARLAPLLRPIFRRSHDAVMRRGERGLRAGLAGSRAELAVKIV